MCGVLHGFDGRGGLERDWHSAANLKFAPPSCKVLHGSTRPSSWASAPLTFLGRSPCLHRCYSSSLAGVPLPALVSLTRWKRCWSLPRRRKMSLASPLCFALSYWLPPVGVTQPKGSHFMQNDSTPCLLHSLPPLLMEHFLLVHPGFVLF